MSHFGLYKKVLLSVSAIQSATVQTMSTTPADVTIFSGASLTQIVSTIGYPSISISSAQITLEAGWHYHISARLKFNTPSATTTQYGIYYIANSAGTQISSTGTLSVSRDSSALKAQENCICYVDATGSSQIIKAVASRFDTSTTLTINGSTNAQATSLTAHLLIKAWK